MGKSDSHRKISIPLERRKGPTAEGKGVGVWDGRRIMTQGKFVLIVDFFLKSWYSRMINKSIKSTNNYGFSLKTPCTLLGE